MKKYSKILFCFFIGVILSVTYLFAEPIIGLEIVNPINTNICSTGNDSIVYTVTASGVPANTNIVIYQSTDSTFNPYLGQGDSIGYIKGDTIERNALPNTSCVDIIGIFIDACNPSGIAEYHNEYMFLNSGNGFLVDSLKVDLPNSNGTGNGDINLGTSSCTIIKPSNALMDTLRKGACNPANFIAAGPGDSIPSHAIVLLFTSNNVTYPYNFDNLCQGGVPVYVIQNSCTRTSGAFVNDANCTNSRYRTTIIYNRNCVGQLTYDRCGLSNQDGNYAVNNGGDTASVANGGIKNNAVNYCDGISFDSLVIRKDTLTYHINQNQCNTGVHYIKAITHPVGTQPVSNTTSYQLICNDVTATTTTNNICSGDTAKINISSNDPNATFSWTVSGGASITGAVAGTGNTIQQALTYNGTTKDSVIYNITSNDAGCIKTTSVKVVVNNCTTDSCSNWLYSYDFSSYIACGDLDIVGNQVTVECKFNAIEWNVPENRQHLVVKHDHPTNVNYSLGTNFTEITTDQDGYALLISECPLDSINKTYYSAFTYDGNYLKLYRNGNLVAQKEHHGTLVNNDLLTTIAQIGGGFGPAFEQFKGYINEVRIWNVARTEQELNTYMNTSLPNPTAQVGLKGYYVFDNLLNKQGDATYNGTIVGTAEINKINPQCNLSVGSCDTICNLTPSISGNLSLCGNGSTTLSIEVQYDSIRWNTGATTSSISVNQAGTYSITAYKDGCTGTSSVNVSEGSITVQITGDTTICGSSRTTLSAEGQYDSVRWNTGAITNSITVNQPGLYTITAYQNGCSGTAAVNVTQTILEPTITGGNTVCGGTHVTLSTQTTYDSVRWNTDETTTSIDVTRTGEYSVTVYKDGCAAFATFTVYQISLDFYLDHKIDTICPGDSAQFIIYSGDILLNPYDTVYFTAPGRYLISYNTSICGIFEDSVVVVERQITQPTISGNLSICENGTTSLDAGTGYDSYTWQPNGEITQSITVTQAGIYTVTTTTRNCSASSSAVVSVISTLQPFTLGNDTAFCGSFSKVLYTGNSTTVWSNGETASQITVSEAGQYIATISNTCSTVSDTVNIAQNNIPIVNIGNDTAICGSELQLNAPTQMQEYVWSDGSQNASITISGAGTYWVNITDANGCTNADSITITTNCARDLWLPNSFTPNGDNVNDVFYIRGNEQNTTIEKFVIFDRWGLKVFEANNFAPNNATFGWNGKYKDQPCQLEVYGYYAIARFQDGQTKTLKGNVTLLK